MAVQDIPEEEQKEAEDYVLKRELNRPKVGVFTVLKNYFIFSTSTLGVSVLFYFFLKFIFPGLAQEIERLIIERPFFSLFIVWAVFHIIGIFVILRQIIIGFIRLYQRYSPEEIRRSCLFKPTCSEYTILAIEKYGVLKGVFRSFNRFKRCNGETYSIDYP